MNWCVFLFKTGSLHTFLNLDGCVFLLSCCLCRYTYTYTYTISVCFQNILGVLIKVSLFVYTMLKNEFYFTRSDSVAFFLYVNMIFFVTSCAKERALISGFNWVIFLINCYKFHMVLLLSTTRNDK